MDKYSIDYEILKKASEERKYFKYEDVKDKLVKVAFDIVKFDDEYQDIDGLWQIRNTPDGEVIVAMYDVPELTAESMDTSSYLKKKAGFFKEADLVDIGPDVSFAFDGSFNWEVVCGRDGSVNIFYKESPVLVISSEEIEPGMDVNEFCKHVKLKLNSDKNYAKSLLSELSGKDRALLLSKFPELTK